MDTGSLDTLEFAKTEIAQTAPRNTATLRKARQRISKQIQKLPPRQVMKIAEMFIDDGPKWVGFELINQHSETMQSLRRSDIERLGEGNQSWGHVDAIGTIISGPAWLSGQIGDRTVIAWARHDNLWWRRTALVSTTVLNTKSRGGFGDAERTLMIVDELKRDNEDLVVKAVSWALRSLAPWDDDKVTEYLSANESVLHARIKREVTKKITSGLKNPK